MSGSTIPAGASSQKLGFAPQQNQTTSSFLSTQIGANGVTTIVGDDGATQPFSINFGTTGLYFVSGINSVGGAVTLAGGTNTLVGGHTNAPAGLQGNWAINTAGGKTVITLGAGADTVVSGGTDTVHAGAANVLIQVASGNTRGTAVDVTTGFVTFVGGASSGANINLGQGGGIIQLGTGGGNVARAGNGNTTLIGGGGGDKLIANTVTGAAGTTLYATGNDTLVGGGQGADTFFGFSSISGNGNVLINVANAQSGQAVWLGGGNDTVRMGAGADSLVASAAYTDGDGRDLIIGWQAQDILYVDGYAGSVTLTDLGSSVRANLSDGTRITFQGVGETSAINIVFGKPG